MKKLTFEERIILLIALKNFIESREEAKENTYIPLQYIVRDIELAKDLSKRINLFEE